MLTRSNCLLDGWGWFAFHHEEVEVFSQEDVDGLVQVANDPVFEVGQAVQNPQRCVLENRIAIQNEQSRFHADITAKKG